MTPVVCGDDQKARMDGDGVDYSLPLTSHRARCSMARFYCNRAHLQRPFRESGKSAPVQGQPTLRNLEAGRRWSFVGDGSTFRRVSEAHPIHQPICLTRSSPSTPHLLIPFHTKSPPCMTRCVHANRFDSFWRMITVQVRLLPQTPPFWSWAKPGQARNLLRAPFTGGLTDAHELLSVPTVLPSRAT